MHMGVDGVPLENNSFRDVNRFSGPQKKYDIRFRCRGGHKQMGSFDDSDQRGMHMGVDGVPLENNSFRDVNRFSGPQKKYDIRFRCHGGHNREMGSFEDSHQQGMHMGVDGVPLENNSFRDVNKFSGPQKMYDVRFRCRGGHNRQMGSFEDSDQQGMHMGVDGVHLENKSFQEVNRFSEPQKKYDVRFRCLGDHNRQMGSFEDSHQQGISSSQNRYSPRFTNYNDSSRKKTNYGGDTDGSLYDTIFSIYNKSLSDLERDSFRKKFCFIRDKVGFEIESHQLFKQKIWEVDELASLRTRLNDVKDELNDNDLNEWHKHTRTMNPASYVVRFTQEDAKAEFVTQAWCKFYEVAYTYLLEWMESVDGDLYTVHLCEAPGAFVSSLNHFLKSNFPNIKWKWMANSLNPFYEGNSLSSMINDDKLILNTEDNWDFGPDQTGDIFAADYVTHLHSEFVKRSFKPNRILLVTADGSFDCQDNPDQQESNVMYLHLTEALIALSILSKGGNFVLKLFTMFECNTVCLMYLLCSAFEKVNVFKPCTSKEGNSETYVVCMNYNGLENIKWIVDSLFDTIRTKNEILETNAIFSREFVSNAFIDEIKFCCKQFAELQMSVIKRNIRLFPNRSDINLRALKKVQMSIFRRYMERYNIKPLDPKDKLVRNSGIQNNVNIIEPRTAVVGSFTERKLKMLQHVHVRVEDIKNELNAAISFVEKSNAAAPKLLTYDDITEKCLTFPYFGKPVLKVLSSQFCYSGFIRLKDKIMNLSPYAAIKCNQPDRHMSSYRKEDWIQILYCCFHHLYAVNDYDEAQKISAIWILNKIECQLEDNGTLVLSGLPLLTHFNVSLIYLISTAFSQVKYSEPAEIVFSNYRCQSGLLNSLKLTVRRYDSHKPQFSMLSFVKMKHLRENKFYSWIVRVNNLTMANQIQIMIDNVQRGQCAERAKIKRDAERNV